MSSSSSSSSSTPPSWFITNPPSWTAAFNSAGPEIIDENGKKKYKIKINNDDN